MSTGRGLWSLRTRLVLPIVLALHASLAGAVDFSNDVINTVRNNMNTSSTASWEMGTAAEAVLEHDLSSHSVFASSPPFTPASSLTPNSVNNVLYFAQRALKQRNGTTTIIKDGSAGDPASLGVAVMLGNLTDNGDTGVTNLTFSQAADEQVQYLLTSVPRAPNGAISHRVNEVSLWADFIYMVPPFLAYYGVVTQNQSMVSTAVDQISAYRDVLRDPGTGLWNHVLLSTDFSDPTLWATGNAWVAAGIVRTLATIQNSKFSGKFKSQKSDLTNWAVEIQNGFYSRVDGTTHLPHNTLNNTSTFYDAASATLMASSVYRLAVLSKQYTNIPNVELFRTALINNTASTSVTLPSPSNNTVGIDKNGWLTPVVNPLSFDVAGSQSPEAESFVLLMEAARSDWVDKGSKGQKGGAGRRSTVTSSFGAFILGGILAAVVAGYGPL